MTGVSKIWCTLTPLKWNYGTINKIIYLNTPEPRSHRQVSIRHKYFIRIFSFVRLAKILSQQLFGYRFFLETKNFAFLKIYLGRTWEFQSWLNSTVAFGPQTEFWGFFCSCIDVFIFSITCTQSERPFRAKDDTHSPNLFHFTQVTRFRP